MLAFNEEQADLPATRVRHQMEDALQATIGGRGLADVQHPARLATRAVVGRAEVADGRSPPQGPSGHVGADAVACPKEVQREAGSGPTRHAKAKSRASSE